jgi:hypothetical protein
LNKYSVIYLLFIFILNAENNSLSYLILNEFETPNSNINQVLIENFDYLDLQFDDITVQYFEENNHPIDFIFLNMDRIKELGTLYGVNYVLFNKIIQIDSMLNLESRLYHTRSGGLINQRKIDLIDYFDGQENELKLWIGELTGGIKPEWQNKRNSILFLNADEIIYKKTPSKSALRSLLIPGWGQLYSDEKLYAVLWFGTELSLGLFSYVFFSNYQNSRNNYLLNQKLYTHSNDEKEVGNYRSLAEKDWDNHKTYSELTILFVKVIGVGWITNTLHAWIVGPRPKTKIHRKWDTPIVNP